MATFGARVAQLDQAGVGQPGEQLDLLPLPSLVRPAHSHREQLDRNRQVQPAVPRPIHLSGAAEPHQLLQFLTAAEDGSGA